MNEITVTPDQAGQRLDKFLLKYMNKATKAFIYKMLRKKRIKLNGQRAEGGELLRQGDQIKMYLAPETIAGFMEEKQVDHNAGEVVVVYEDENILICDKQAGVLSQPDSAGGGSMTERILYYLHQKGEFSTDKASVFTPALCNRLDRNTSGLVICGKNLQASQALNEAIRNRKIDKYYICAVFGRLNEKLVLKAHLQKDSAQNQAEIIPEDKGGKEIITIVEPLRSVNSGYYTIVRVKLVTGKTHQIRAHMQSIGHPVLGDPKYGDASVNKEIRDKYSLSDQLLHAYELEFKTNTGFLEYMNGKVIKSHLPKWYKKILL